MRFGFFLLAFCLLASLGYAQQQAMYTQYMFNTLAINPAYATIDESFTVTTLLRNQWVGFKGAPKTQSLAIHTPIKESNTFVGALLVNDQIGEVLKETGVYGTVSQRVEIADETFLAVGINGGISSFQANYSDNYPYSPESITDPMFANSKTMRGNFGVGVMYFTKQYYLGISSPYFFTRDFSSFSKENASPKVKPHYLMQGGVLLNLGEDFKLKPNFLIKYVNGAPFQADLNANLLIKEAVWFGASYRTYDSFDILASVFITPDIQFGYSYDFTNTELSKIQKGSHEIMLKFRMAVRGREHVKCFF